MPRKPHLPFAAIILALVLTTGSDLAHALGMGDITLRSALNERLDAEIELVEVGRLTPDEIVARLASSADFERLGVQRYFNLADLRFTLETRADGRTLVRVTSREPVVEPFLNFVVELRWPLGRMLKEYTLLLDPPTYAARSASPVTAPARASATEAPAGRIERHTDAPIERTVERTSGDEVQLPPPVAPATTRAPSTEERLHGDTYGFTDRDDTLWRIAARTRRAADISIQQQMLAIFELNPEAFINGNINLLKAGYVLRLPDAAQAQSRSLADATAQVAVHNEHWQAWRRGEAPLVAAGAVEAPRHRAQLDATPGEAPIASAEVRPDGELRIVAVGEGESGAAAGSPDAERMAELASRLAASEEERERVVRENSDFAGVLDQLMVQAEQAQRQLEVRDQQLAVLQQQLEAARRGDADRALEATQPAGARASASILGMAPSNWAMLGGGALAVLMATWVLLHRRRATPDEPLAPLEIAAAAAPTRSSRQKTEPTARTTRARTEPASASASHAAPVRRREEAPVAQTDPIEEADVYIAYGRYQQAADRLQNAVQNEPHRADLWLKLLEIDAATGDGRAFAAHKSGLEACTDAPEALAAAREFESALQQFRGDLSPGSDDSDGDLVPPTLAPVASEREPFAGLDFELALDLDDEVAESGSPRDDESEPTSSYVPPAFALANGARDAGTDDLGGDLGINFDGTPRATNGATANLDDFDLEDLRFDAEEGQDGVARGVESVEAEDDSFDFLDDGDAASTKLDLARAYIDMGDGDGAKEILDEVLNEGSGEQKQRARELLQELA
jgi:pilus assembly protein FimV